MRSFIIVLCVLVSIALVFVVDAYLQEDVPTQTEPLAYEEMTLDNGMRVIVVPNHSIPAVNHTIWLKLGSADEPAGKSGVAHYLEHLMFKGTETMASGEYSKTIERLGGNHNAFTGRDFTGYYVTVAKEHLEQVMQLEVERFTKLQPSSEEYDEERQVILEERYLRVENRPNALLAEEVMATLYRHHPYRIPIIGWKHEMESLTLEDAMAFYDGYYDPANLVLVLAGDVTLDEIEPLVEQYYGAMESKRAYARNWVQEPPFRAPKIVDFAHPQVTQKEWVRYYAAPSLGTEHSEHAMPLTLLSHILGGSTTSLLYQDLVVEQGIASDVGVSYSALAAGPSVFSIGVTPAAGVSLETIETATEAALHKALANGLSQELLARAQVQYNAAATYAREGLYALGAFAGQLAVSDIHVGYMQDWADYIDAVTVEQMQAAATFVLKPERSVTGYLTPQQATPQTGDSDAS